jgi:transcriptional regulator with XRE-family HTH domain
MGKELQKTDSSLSAEVVTFLREQGLTLKEIGQLLDLSESFMSRVARGERSLTIDHLKKLEQNLNQPLPLLLLQATAKTSISKELRPYYDEALKLLERSGRLKSELFGKNRPLSSKSKSRAAG